MEISQKIVDYSIWYYLKYYPSKRKLKRKLIEKFWVNSENGKKYWWIWDEEIDYILNYKMSSIIDEKAVILSKIRVFKNKWKSKIYIKQKLYERLEPKDLIEELLEQEFLDWELEILRNEYQKVKTKIRNYVSESDYNQKIIQKLMMKGFKYDDIKQLIK